jgi:hypothetical protein
MRTPAGYVRGVKHPEAFHGRGADGHFFEGWYIKLVNADLTQRWAIIPGVFKSPAGNKTVPAGPHDNEAFVQVLQGIAGNSWFNTYDLTQFKASDRRFDVTVAGSHFDATGVTLDLPQLQGRIDFKTPMDPWPVSWAAPGIMGWFGLVPFMQCFHGIVSFGHELAGSLTIDGKEVSFDGGRGYIEKDWGKAFPDGYVWLHTNHIDFDPDASLIASVAVIPWLGGAFRGFIVGLRHNGRLLRWATWNGAVERKLAIDDFSVQWVLSGPDGILELTAERKRGGLLHAPPRTTIQERVEETMDATVSIRLLATDGLRVLAQGKGQAAGMEVFGDLEKLLGVKAKPSL